MYDGAILKKELFWSNFLITGKNKCRRLQGKAGMLPVRGLYQTEGARGKER